MGVQAARGEEQEQRPNYVVLLRGRNAYATAVTAKRQLDSFIRRTPRFSAAQVKVVGRGKASRLEIFGGLPKSPAVTVLDRLRCKYKIAKRAC
jgi:hypothetical protein